MNSPLLRLMDCHLHTAVTVDARMSESEACERATARGIQEIAFTNHIMLNQPAYLMSPEAFAVHRQNIEACRQTYPRLVIKLGIEVDYYPGREQEIAATIREYECVLGRPFDLVLGSIHELNGVFFSNQHHAPALYKDSDLASLYFEYFAVATQAVRSRLFDVMAHPDLIRKYTHELAPLLPFECYRTAVEPYINALLETETGIEVNTKGLRLPLKETYPSKELLALYISKAMETCSSAIVTLGSDAHRSDNVGDHVLEGALLLRDLGITELASFEARQRSHWKL